MGASILAVGLWTLATAGACDDSGESEVRATDRTIGYYCDLLLPSFCTYAVNSCRVGGTVADCVTVSRPSCCQGACQRAARPVCETDPCPEGGEAALVAGCLEAYTGSATPIADASGDAGASGAAGSTGSGASGLDCASLNAGFAPQACTEKFLLLGLPKAPVDPATGQRVELR